MALIPDRAVVLVAASTSVADIMEAYYASLGTSAWSATLQVPTSTGGPGSFAMTLRNATGTIELNILNYGDPVQAAGSPDPSQPSTTVVRHGINPDGSSDPITDCTDPYGTPGGTGPANFSGADNGPAVTAVIGSPEFIVLEWDDTILFLFKDALKNYCPFMWYWGKPWQPVMPSLAESANLRLDGHMIFAGVPGSGAYQFFAPNYQTPRVTRRVAVGNTVDTVPAHLTGWAKVTTASSNLRTVAVNNLAYYRYGPDNAYIVQPLVWTPYDVTATPDCYIDKYMRSVPPGNYPFDVWAVGGENRYMVIWNSWSSGAYIAVPVPADFNPSP